MGGAVGAGGATFRAGARLGGGGAQDWAGKSSPRRLPMASRAGSCARTLLPFAEVSVPIAAASIPAVIGASSCGIGAHAAAAAAAPTNTVHPRILFLCTAL